MLPLLLKSPTNKIDAGRRGYLLDGVAGPQANPLRDGTVLALGFGKLLLGAETLVALKKKRCVSNVFVDRSS